MDSKVFESNLVAYMLNGLSSKFWYVAINIHHRDPLPSFWDVRSILVCEEQQMLRDEQRDYSHSDNASL